ncbi:MAG TPA: tetratricopeptide repeat protein, partial [Bryobacteraceae bacterium]|nr:tetratricopeptide repeat protein [Bryobacteraceae bacterium]
LARSGAVPGSAEFSDAVRAAQTAVRLQPDLGLARGVLGKLYLQEGNVDAAIEQSRLAYESDPADVTALYHLIRALKKAGRTQEIPALTRKLADLRQQAQKKEMSERQFAIVSHAANGGASLRR